MTESEIRNALSNNKVVHWFNNGYVVKKGINNKLYVIFVSNDFTSYLVESDLKDCYIEN